MFALQPLAVVAARLGVRLVCDHNLGGELGEIIHSPGWKALISVTGPDFPQLPPTTAAVRLLQAADAMPQEFRARLRMIAGDLAAPHTWLAPVGYRARAGDAAALAEVEAFYPHELIEFAEGGIDATSR